MKHSFRLWACRIIFISICITVTLKSDYKDWEICSNTHLGEELWCGHRSQFKLSLPCLVLTQKKEWKKIRSRIFTDILPGDSYKAYKSNVPFSQVVKWNFVLSIDHKIYSGTKKYPIKKSNKKSMENWPNTFVFVYHCWLTEAYFFLNSKKVGWTSKSKSEILLVLHWNIFVWLY